MLHTDNEKRLNKSLRHKQRLTSYSSSEPRNHSGRCFSHSGSGDQDSYSPIFAPTIELAKRA